MTDSRAKGARGEREAAKEWARVTGFAARRGQQFSGSPDSPDVATEAAIHLEVKRCERGNVYDWMRQAIDDCGEKCPVVLHRRNQHPWLLIVRLDDVARLAQAIAEKAQALGEPEIPGSVPSAGVHPGPEEDGPGARSVRLRC